MQTALMQKSPGATTNEVEGVTILSISPDVEDQFALERILGASDRAQNWVVQVMPALESALPMLREQEIPIVLTERDLLPGTWTDVLGELVSLADPPLLIVTSRLADECLWAEALNLGAFDVLAKPFRADEVIRTLSLAWRHWQDRHSLHSKRTKQRTVQSAA
jgi:DNA-binding response OmpR family regulator